MMTVPVSPQAAQNSKLISSEKPFHFYKPSTGHFFSDHITLIFQPPFDHTTLIFPMWQLISFSPDFYIKILENSLKPPRCRFS